MNVIIRSFAAISLAIGSASFAAILPGSEGKLDYGVEDLPVPPPILMNQTPVRTAQLLADLYSNRQPAFIRVQCIREAGESRLLPALSAVKKALSDPDAEVRAAAAEALIPLTAEDSRSAETRRRALGDPAMTAGLKKLLTDGEGPVRAAALRAVVAIEGPDSPAMAEALSSTDAARLGVAVSLALTPEQGQVIGSRLEAMPSRAAAIRALGRTKAVSQRPLLEKLALGKDISDAAGACDSLGALSRPESAALLQQLCGHPHATVRRSALRALGQCGTVDVRRQQGVPMLADPEPSVQQAAVEVLGANLIPDLVAKVGAKLGHEYAPLYRAARVALSTQTDAATRESCINYAGDLLDNPDPRRREDGSYILGQYRSKHRLARQIEIATDPPADADWGSVAQAIESLGRIGDQQAIPAVMALVKRYDEITRNSRAAESRTTVRAFVAAGRLGIGEILPIAARVMKLDPLTSDSEERASATFAIGAAGTAQSPGTKDLIGVLSRPMDGNKAEVLKAIGNIRLKGADKRIQDFPMSESPQLKWLIQWAMARITGQDEQHPPTPVPWSIRTFYRDITPQPER